MRSPATTAHAGQYRRHSPRRIYPRDAFVRASGISKSRLREARLMGCPLPVISLGRRQTVRGADAVQWIEQLATLMAEREAADA